MARRVSKWIAATFTTLAVLIIFVVGASAIIHASWNSERAAKTISAWASDTLSGNGGPTQQALVIERVEYPLWPALRSLFGGAPLRVHVYGFHIYDPDGREVLGARHVNVGLRLGKLVWQKLWGLLPGPRDDVELFFVNAHIDEVHAHIAPDEAGDVNLFAAFRRKKGTESRRDEKAGLVIDVDGSRVDEANLSAAFPGWSANIEGATIDQDRLRYSSFHEEQRDTSPAFTYHVEKIVAPRGQVTIDQLRFPIDDIVTSELYAAEPERSTVHVASRARCLGASTEIHGVLLDIYTHAGADIHMSAQHGARVLERLPSKKYLSGDASATMHVTGPFASAKLEGSARELEGHVLDFELTDGSGHYRLEHDKLTLTQMHASLAGGVVDAEGSIALRTKTFELTLYPKGLKIGELGRFAIVEIGSAIAGLAAHPATDGSGELQNELKVRGVDVALYRRARVDPPDRVVVKN